MKINVAQLLKSPVGTVRTFDLEGRVKEVDDTGIPREVTGSGEVVRTNQGVLARVKAHLETREECSRCLTMFRNPIDIAFEEMFFPSVDVSTGAPLPPPPDPDPFYIDHNHVLDVEPAVRVYALVARPIQPLCREDCRGLCPTCGKDLNQGPCNCDEKSIDPRWASLRRLATEE
jgi:uncharacterized protein